MKYWLFQAVPSVYDLLTEITARKGDVWHPTCHIDDMKKGDKVVLWQSGPSAGVYGFAELTTGAYGRRGHSRVGIGKMALLPQPIFRRELLKNRMFRNFGVLRMPHGRNPFTVSPSQWSALSSISRSEHLNIFRSYGQQENRFTNGLICLLQLADHEKVPLLSALLDCLPHATLLGPILSYRVLRAVDGTADAELCSKDCCIRIETKIEPRALRDAQIIAHLKSLDRVGQRRKMLVLLTPDDGRSKYILGILRKHGKRVAHVDWNRVYHRLERVKDGAKGVVHELVRQYVDEIRGCILEHDFKGVLLKVRFGERSGLSSKTLIPTLRDEDYWHTPRRYDKLDGGERKLLLYDPEKAAIVAEAEIREITREPYRRRFPWKNRFKPGTRRIFRNGIDLETIQTVPGLENFGSGRTGAWLLTGQQYQMLMNKS